MKNLILALAASLFLSGCLVTDGYGSYRLDSGYTGHDRNDRIRECVRLYRKYGLDSYHYGYYGGYGHYGLSHGYYC